MIDILPYELLLRIVSYILPVHIGDTKPNIIWLHNKENHPILKNGCRTVCNMMLCKYLYHILTLGGLKVIYPSTISYSAISKYGSTHIIAPNSDVVYDNLPDSVEYVYRDVTTMTMYDILLRSHF